MVSVYPQGTHGHRPVASVRRPAFSRACACARYPYSGAPLFRDTSRTWWKIIFANLEKNICLYSRGAYNVAHGSVEPWPSERDEQ